MLLLLELFGRHRLNVQRIHLVCRDLRRVSNTSIFRRREEQLDAIVRDARSIDAHRSGLWTVEQDRSRRSRITHVVVVGIGCCRLQVRRPWNLFARRSRQQVSVSILVPSGRFEGHLSLVGLVPFGSERQVWRMLQLWELKRSSLARTGGGRVRSATYAADDVVRIRRLPNTVLHDAASCQRARCSTGLTVAGDTVFGVSIEISRN